MDDPFADGPPYRQLIEDHLGPNWRMSAPCDLTASDGTPIPVGTTLTAAEAHDAGISIIVESA